MKAFYLHRIRGPETHSGGLQHSSREPRWMTFTDSEQSDRKYTVQFAVDQAKIILAASRRKGQASMPLCMNSLQRRDLDEKITLFEVNRIHERLVADSFFHERNPGWGE